MGSQTGKAGLFSPWPLVGLIALALLIDIAVAGGCGGDGPYRTLRDLKLALSPSTLAVGDNQIDVLITDSAGNPVTDASVSLELVHSTMQMPKNVAGAIHEGAGHYVCILNVAMAGSWAIFAEVSWKGQSLGRTEFQVQARAAPAGATPRLPVQHSH